MLTRDNPETDERAMKHVFGEITLLITDYMIFLHVEGSSLQLQVYLVV